MTARRALAAPAMVAMLLCLSASQAVGGDLGIRRSYGTNGLERGYVVAESRFGNGSVRAPVRMTRNGPQVRHPGGAWIYCRRSCSETLRVETVDIFEAIDGYGAECGLLGCLELVYPR